MRRITGRPANSIVLPVTRICGTEWRNSRTMSCAKHGQESGQRSPAVAEREFGFEIDFRHGAVQLGEIKQRVVSETAGAARGFEDEAFDGAVGGVYGLAVARGDQRAMVMRGTLRGRDSGHALQKDH